MVASHILPGLQKLGSENWLLGVLLGVCSLTVLCPPRGRFPSKSVALFFKGVLCLLGLMECPCVPEPRETLQWQSPIQRSVQEWVICDAGRRGVSQSHLNWAGTQGKLCGCSHSQGTVSTTAVSDAPMGTEVLCRGHLDCYCPWVPHHGRLYQRSCLLCPTF